jgi:SAM-dependent methyltransferase
MAMTSDPRALFTAKHVGYARFIHLVSYPQGLRAFFARASWLRSDLRVLDAGCGTGVVTLALRDAVVRRGFAPGPMQAFDLTPAMLDHFRDVLRARGIDGIDMREANVLELAPCPTGGRDTTSSCRRRCSSTYRAIGSPTRFGDCAHASAPAGGSSSSSRSGTGSRAR